jgi:hypothetical protein
MVQHIDQSYKPIVDREGAAEMSNNFAQKISAQHGELAFSKVSDRNQADRNDDLRNGANGRPPSPISYAL